MANECWNRADCCSQWVEECIAMANAAVGNRTRAELYAAAQYYVTLSKIERNLAGSNQLVVEADHLAQGQCE
jgi:hypothetical protein